MQTLRPEYEYIGIEEFKGELWHAFRPKPNTFPVDDIKLVKEIKIRDANTGEYRYWTAKQLTLANSK